MLYVSLKHIVSRIGKCNMRAMMGDFMFLIVSQGEFFIPTRLCVQSDRLLLATGINAPTPSYCFLSAFTCLNIETKEIR